MLLNKAFATYCIGLVVLIIYLILGKDLVGAMTIFTLSFLVFIIWAEGRAASEYAPGRMIDKLVVGDNDKPLPHIRRYKIVQDARLKEKDND